MFGGLGLQWYDDGETLAVKYKAVKALGVKGLGVWTSDAAGFNRELETSMWAALPVPQSTPSSATALKTDDENKPHVRWPPEAAIRSPECKGCK